MAEIKDQIETDAAKPVEVETEGQGRIRRRSIDEQIKADAYVRNQEAAANPFAQLRRARINPGSPNTPNQ